MNLNLTVRLRLVLTKQFDYAITDKLDIVCRFMLSMFKGLNCYKSVKIVFNFLFYNVQLIGPKTIVL